MRRSDLRRNDSAVQSRVGDGMGTRLPEHEVRGESEGQTAWRNQKSLQGLKPWPPTSAMSGL